MEEQQPADPIKVETIINALHKSHGMSRSAAEALCVFIDTDERADKVLQALWAPNAAYRDEEQAAPVPPEPPSAPDLYGEISEAWDRLTNVRETPLELTASPVLLAAARGILLIAQAQAKSLKELQEIRGALFSRSSILNASSWI